MLRKQFFPFVLQTTIMLMLLPQNHDGNINAPLNIHILMTQCLSDGQPVSEKHKNFNDQHFLCVEEEVLSAVLEQGKG